MPGCFIQSGIQGLVVMVVDLMFDYHPSPTLAR